MKGRWFFWIPTITYGLYYLINNVYIPSKVINMILWILFVIWAVINAASTIMYVTNAEDFRDDTDDMLGGYIIEIIGAFLFCTVPAVVITINYYFDKYLTIRK